jgi:hypothetical protein
MRTIEGRDALNLDQENENSMSLRAPGRILMNGHQNWFTAALLAVLASFNIGTTSAQQYTISTLDTSGVTVTTGEPNVGNGVAADAAGNVYLIGSYPPPNAFLVI